MLALNGAIFVSMLGFGIISPILPIFAKNMGASALMVGIMFGSFSLSRGLVAPWVGMLSDRWGRKKFLLLSLAGFTLLSLALVWTTSPIDLTLNRLLQGIFSAMLMPVAMAMVADMAPQGFEGRAFAGFNTAFLLGLGLGPFLAGIIYDFFGVEANFLFLSSVCGLSFVVVWLSVGEPPRRQAPAAGGAWRDLRLLRDRSMQGLFINRIATSLGTSIFLAFLPVLGASKGLSNIQIGILFGVNTLVMTAMQKPSSWLADSKYRLPLGIGGSVMVGGCRLLLALSSDFITFLLVIILDGVAAGIIVPAVNALGIDGGRRLCAGMGAVMGFFTLAMSIGFCAGPIAGGWLTDQISLQACFCITGVIVVAGSVAPLVMRAPPPQ
jgi:MFS family permease